MSIKNYKDLTVWQKAMDLVEHVYRVPKEFPRDELYGLTSQMRRSAISIPSNIAEGQGRGADPEFLRFLKIAYGSLRELETQAMISRRLGFVQRDAAEALLDLGGEVGRLLNGLMNTINKSGEK